MENKNKLVVAACGLALVAAGALVWRSFSAAPPTLSEDVITKNAQATEGAELPSAAPAPDKPASGGRNMRKAGS